MNQQDYLFFFADLIDSTIVAEHMSPGEYATSYMASLHWACNAAWHWTETKHPQILRQCQMVKPAQNILRHPYVVGDEVYSFTPLQSTKPDENYGIDEVITAIGFAYALKLYWLASPVNLDRMIAGKPPDDIGIGIHVGPATDIHFDYRYRMGKGKSADCIVGRDISATKRLESASRGGKRSRIFVSNAVNRKFVQWQNLTAAAGEGFETSLGVFFRFAEVAPIKPKGFKDPIAAYELDLNTAQENHPRFERLLSGIQQDGHRPSKYIDRVFKGMGETFLVPRTKPFSDRNGFPFVQQNIAQTPAEYMSKGLNATEGLERLYTDNIWGRFNHFLICAMWMWHPDRGEMNEQLNRYRRDVAAKLHEAIQSIGTSKAILRTPPDNPIRQINPESA